MAVILLERLPGPLLVKPAMILAAPWILLRMSIRWNRLMPVHFVIAVHPNLLVMLIAAVLQILLKLMVHMSALTVITVFLRLSIMPVQKPRQGVA